MITRTTVATTAAAPAAARYVVEQLRREGIKIVPEVLPWPSWQDDSCTLAPRIGFSLAQQARYQMWALGGFEGIELAALMALDDIGRVVAVMAAGCAAR